MTDTNPLAPIEALHHPIPIYPHEFDCADEEHAFEPMEDFCRDCPPIGQACETCRDEDGEWIEWPCVTADALTEARQAVDVLVAERDAYRKAKQENDERFMLERDEARAERDAAREALARVEALAKTQATSLQAAHRADMARNWLDVLAIIERAAPAQTATGEEAGQ